MVRSVAGAERRFQTHHAPRLTTAPSALHACPPQLTSSRGCRKRRESRSLEQAPPRAHSTAHLLGSTNCQSERTAANSSATMMAPLAVTHCCC